MKPIPAIDNQCRVLAEFTDDASQFAEGEPEFVPVATPSARGAPSAVDAGSQYIFSPPSAESSAVAKTFWLDVIGRFTEPVAGRGNRLRVLDAAEPNRGTIEVEYLPRFGLSFDLDSISGRELDVAHKQWLVLYDHREPSQYPGDPDGQLRVRESAVPILWTEIARMHFSVDRPVPVEAATKPAEGKRQKKKA
jgi:hypothetical protein